MTQAFSRSMRSLEVDSNRRWRWAVPLALLLLGSWCAWMVTADVPLYAKSQAARLVNERATYRIESGVAGRVLRVPARLDAEVREGDVLVELDASAESLALEEEGARAATLEQQILATGQVIRALEEARDQARGADEALLEEARLEVSRREFEWEIAKEESQRLVELAAGGGAAELTLSKARAEAEMAGVALEAQRVTLRRAPLDAQRLAGEREAELAERRRQLAERRGGLEVARAVIARLEHERTLRTIRAPAAGRIAELRTVSPGDFLEAARSLGTIVGPGRVAVEAEFAPADVLGKVRLGSRGEMALGGFPRAEFGSLAGEVKRIASEARDGMIRVELELHDEQRADVPREHGLPGELRVETERTSPAALVLRSIGGALGLGQAGSDD